MTPSSMDARLVPTWNRASRTYDLFTWGDERRFAAAKPRLFAAMSGECLMMTPLSRRLGPEMNRDTTGTVLRAGFELCREENVYLDVVRAIEARRPPRAGTDADPRGQG